MNSLRTLKKHFPGTMATATPASTFLDLVQVASEVAASPAETAKIVEDLVRAGRIQITDRVRTHGIGV